MATQSKTVSGNSTIYTITDVTGASVVLTQAKVPGQSVTVSYSGGPCIQDANEMAAQLLLLLATGLTP